MKHRFKTEILIQDKRLDWMISRGINPKWWKLPDEEFEKHLRNKLMEKVKEEDEANNEKSFIEKLGDVLEVAIIFVN